MKFDTFRRNTVVDEALTKKEVNDMAVNLFLIFGGIQFMTFAVAKVRLGIAFPISSIMFIILVVLYVGIFELLDGNTEGIRRLHKITKLGRLLFVLFIVFGVAMILL